MSKHVVNIHFLGAAIKEFFKENESVLMFDVRGVRRLASDVRSELMNRNDSDAVLEWRSIVQFNARQILDALVVNALSLNYASFSDDKNYFGNVISQFVEDVDLAELDYNHNDYVLELFDPLYITSTQLLDTLHDRDDYSCWSNVKYYIKNYTLYIEEDGDLRIDTYHKLFGGEIALFGGYGSLEEAINKAYGKSHI